MAYPNNKPSGEYALRDYDFATNDTNKLPINEYLYKNGYKNADESEIDSVPDAHNVNWLYDVLNRNLRYTQQVAEENKKQLETKLATPTSIGQVKVGYGLEITSNGVLSVSKGIAEDANIISYDLSVGSYMLWAGKNTPEYFIEPAGQTLLKSNYPELWQFAQDNNLIGTLFTNVDNDSFKVTDIRGNFISIANSNDKVGKFTQAGLPNIVGTLKPIAFGREGNPATFTGAFTESVQAYEGNYRLQGGVDNTATYTQSLLDFKASNSNSTYGKSNTVTPANWGLKLILKALPTPPSNAVPTGTILDYTGTSAPDGYIVANGAELSRSTFSQLWNWANANNLVKPQNTIPATAHAYYGTGNGTTTFTIPDVRAVFRRSADLASNRGGADVGAYQADGLPNIVGYTGYGANTNEMNMLNSVMQNNAFYPQNISDRSLGFNEFQGHSLEGFFDASRSNSIYGKSLYVQPKSISILPILKY